uniref:Uncharacterized protein n=1 Tax=Solanum tuberosum TaxID=4113 RepID=M1DKJ2_SOLTU
MAESTISQTEVLDSPVPLSPENLVCSPTLVVSENKFQDFAAQSVAKPLDKHIYEETEAGSMAVSETSPVRRVDSGEERQRKGKGKLVKAHLKGQGKKYGTRSVTQKVLGSAMEANAAHTEMIRKRRLRGSLDAEPTSIPVNVDDSDTQYENIIISVIKHKREAEEKRVNSEKSHKKAKKSIAKKGKNTKKKMTQLGSPEVEEISERFD